MSNHAVKLMTTWTLGSQIDCTCGASFRASTRRAVQWLWTEHVRETT